MKTTDANLNVDKQLSDIDTFITQKVKAIVVWPLSSEAVQPALARAQAANIPIIAIYALTEGPYFTDLIIDGKGVGEDAAKYLADAVRANGKVAAIFGRRRSISSVRSPRASRRARRPASTSSTARSTRRSRRRAPRTSCRRSSRSSARR